MWKKLLYGASKRFANDTSNIVAKEMKKKLTQQKHFSSFDSDSVEDKERAIYLNRLRQILLVNQKMLPALIDILNSMKRCIEPPFDDEGLVEYSQLLLDINDMAYEKNQEAIEINEVGEQLSEQTEDYTVEYKSLDVSLINAEIIDMTNEIYNLLTADETAFDDTLMKTLDIYIDKSLNFIERINEKYEEITKMNIAMKWDKTRGERTIDYNDY